MHMCKSASMHQYVWNNYVGNTYNPVSLCVFIIMLYCIEFVNLLKYIIMALLLYGVSITRSANAY